LSAYENADYISWQVNSPVLEYMCGQ
jgi:hypothetical protein